MGLCRGYVGIMEKEMETTAVSMGNIGRFLFLGGPYSKDCSNRFLLLINPPLIINNKSGNPKMPHEHFKRGCTNFKRSKTIMN